VQLGAKISAVRQVLTCYKFNMLNFVCSFCIQNTLFADTTRQDTYDRSLLGCHLHGNRGSWVLYICNSYILVFCQ